MASKLHRKEAACFPRGAGIACLGAVVWTQFYSKSAYREVWYPIRRSPDQRFWPGFLLAPRRSRAIGFRPVDLDGREVLGRQQGKRRAQ